MREYVSRLFQPPIQLLRITRRSAGLAKPRTSSLSKRLKSLCIFRLDSYKSSTRLSPGDFLPTPPRQGQMEGDWMFLLRSFLFLLFFAGSIPCTQGANRQ